MKVLLFYSPTALGHLYSDYETRKIRIPLDSVIILAKYYNVDMNYITGISDVKNPFPNK